MAINDSEEEEFMSMTYDYMAYGFHDDFPNYQATLRSGEIKTVEDLVNYNDEHSVWVLLVGSFHS